MRLAECGLVLNSTNSPRQATHLIFDEHDLVADHPVLAAARAEQHVVSTRWVEQSVLSEDGSRKDEGEYALKSRRGGDLKEKDDGTSR